MIDPIFWLGLSILLVAVSLTAVLVVAIPAFKELGRASRSAEKLFDTLSRELPPTLEAIRLTSLEITELTDDMSTGVQNVGQVTQQVNESVSGVAKQAKQAGATTRSVFVGMKAAWKTFNRSGDRQEEHLEREYASGQLPAGAEPELTFEAEADDNSLILYEDTTEGISRADSAYADKGRSRQEEDLPR